MREKRQPNGGEQILILLVMMLSECSDASRRSSIMSYSKWINENPGTWGCILSALNTSPQTCYNYICQIEECRDEVSGVNKLGMDLYWAAMLTDLGYKI